MLHASLSLRTHIFLSTYMCVARISLSTHTHISHYLHVCCTHLSLYAHTSLSLLTCVLHTSPSLRTHIYTFVCTSSHMYTCGSVCACVRLYILMVLRAVMLARVTCDVCASTTHVCVSLYTCTHKQRRTHVFSPLCNISIACFFPLCIAFLFPPYVLVLCVDTWV